MAVKRKEPKPKTCLECAEPLGPGRGDRKFCNDICRTAFNNRKRKDPVPIPKNDSHPDEDKSDYKKIYRILLKNRESLFFYREFIESKIDLRDLLGHGFNPKFFTSEYQDKHGTVYRFCFDYGYHIAPNDKVYLIYRPEEAFIA